MKIIEQAYKKRSKKVNKVEKIKQEKEPIEALKKLETYAQNGYDALPAEDKAFFLKCFGIFDKEKVNGKNSFMLRVRIPGGKLNFSQAVAIGEVAKAYGRDSIDLTTRMQIELRYLRLEDLPVILKKLEKAGTTTYQTGVDNFRNIVTSALDGVGKDSVIEVQPILERLQTIFLKKEEWIGKLPRKFNTAILGNRTNDCNIYGHDCCFVLAEKENSHGFNVYLGGKVGVQAQAADIFVLEEEVEVFYKALIEIFKQYGFRDNRNKNRLYNLIESIGLEAFINVIRKKAGIDFQTRGENLVNIEPWIPQNSIITLKNQKYAVHFSVPSGLFSGTDMIKAGILAKMYDGEIRLSVEQNFFIAGVDAITVDKIKMSNLYEKYAAYENIYFTNQIACAGIETCAFGVIPNKSDAIEMGAYLHQEVFLEDGKVRMYWSACPKGCGIHGIGDIGFEGCKAKDVDGNKVDGVHIFLGGKATHEAKEARAVYKFVPLKDAKKIVKKIMLLYKHEKKMYESFEEYESRVLSYLKIEVLKMKIEKAEELFFNRTNN